MAVTSDEFDRQVRAHIYDTIFATGAIPTVAASATELGCPATDITAAFQRLAAGHIVVLQPGGDEILMANPFSAVPTPFQVEAGDHSYWGNCIWDALGILAMLKRDGRVLASCGDCNAALALTVRDGAVLDAPYVAHFSVAAKHWWDNIVFT